MTNHAPRAAGRSRWLGLAAVATILLVATVAMPFWTSATTVRSEQDVTIAQTETIDDDLFVMAETFRLDGTAMRDVFAAARVIDIVGEVGGSINAVGGDIEITGPVTGSVRVAGGNATISGEVGGDLIVMGGTVTVRGSAVIGGDVQVYGGTVELGGTVRGDVSGSVGSFDLNGSVEGDVLIDVDDLSLGSQSEIGGDLNYVSPSGADVAGSAQIVGNTDHKTVAPWGVDESLRGRFFSPLVRTVWLLVTGAIIIALAPRIVSATNANLRRPLLAGLVGVASIILIPFAAILLAITVVGVPASLILIVAYVVALYLSQFVVGQRIGALLLPRRWNDGSRGFLLLSMTIGVILLSVLRYVPVPFVGGIVNGLIAVLGLGAAVLLFRHLRPWYTASQATV